MCPSEDAEVVYEPDDDERGAIQLALEKAEREISSLNGVHGVGLTKAANGDDAIIVYVQDRETLSLLPAHVGGFSVIGEITGQIQAQ